MDVNHNLLQDLQLTTAAGAATGAGLVGGSVDCGEAPTSAGKSMSSFILQNVSSFISFRT